VIGTRFSRKEEKKKMDIAAAAQSVQGKVVGVIIPPPEIRAVVDKTAQFVAKHGKSFEQKILNSNEGKTAKFNFMKELDPYHAYYEMKIREIEEAIAAGKDPNEVVSKPISAPLPITAVNNGAPTVDKKRTSQVSSNVKASIVNPVAMLAKNQPKEGPYSFEFSLNHPTGVSAVEIDIIKLTAQYTAVNGREFLAALAQREQKNRMFDFLKPTHLLFGYFTSLVDVYAKIVHPSENLKARVQQRQQRQFVLETCVHRWSWSHAETERKLSTQNQDDAERIAFQNVDWNDFAVVEVINFDESELIDLPGLTPVTESDVQAAIGRRLPPPPPPPPSSTATMSVRPPPPPPLPTASVAGAVPLPPPPPPPLPASTKMDDDEEEDGDDDIKVVSNFTPRIVGATSNPTVPAMTIDPITGKAIPFDQLEEHVRIQLIDPKYKEELKRFQAKQSGYSGSLGATEGDTIAESLKLLAKKRGDIFGQNTGVGADSAKRIAEAQLHEQKQYEVSSSFQWDGRATTAASLVQQKQEYAAMPTAATGSVYSGYNAGVTVTPQGPAAMPPLPPMPMSIAPGMGMGMGMVPPPPPHTLPTHSAMGMGMGMAPPPPPPPPLPMAIPGVPVPPIPIPGILPSPSAAMTVVVTGVASADADGRPNSKRPRVNGADDVNETSTSGAPLISAEEFAQQHPGPITLHISIPQDVSAAHWQFNGQTVTLDLPHGVTTSVKEVKELLASQHLANMPINKLQLKSAHIGFWKDAATLASCNIAGGSNVLIEASVKSRGGKR
jgi:splicing factor 3A subunit 1